MHSQRLCFILCSTCPAKHIEQHWNNHPIEITGEQHYNDSLEYIHQNPVLAGWVYDAAHYPWSSAIDYTGRPGMVPVIML